MLKIWIRLQGCVFFPVIIYWDRETFFAQNFLKCNCMNFGWSLALQNTNKVTRIFLAKFCKILFPVWRFEGSLLRQWAEEDHYGNLHFPPLPLLLLLNTTFHTLLSCLCHAMGWDLCFNLLGDFKCGPCFVILKVNWVTEISILCNLHN